MSEVQPRHIVIRARSVDRLINFSDAVVAVAVTVLVLPLVDIMPAEGETVWRVFGDNSGQIFGFLFTFYVVAIMWQTHNRILNGIRSYDGTIFWLNTTWLVAIVLLPWFSAMFGESFNSDSIAPGAWVTYWGTLAAISLLGTTIAWHLRRRPELLVNAVASEAVNRKAMLRGPVFAAYFLLIAAASEVNPDVASWLPLGIIPLSIWMRPGRGEQQTLALSDQVEEDA